MLLKFIKDNNVFSLIKTINTDSHSLVICESVLILNQFRVKHFVILEKGKGICVWQYMKKIVCQTNHKIKARYLKLISGFYFMISLINYRIRDFV